MEEQFTVKGIRSTSRMNRAAFDECQQALEARRSMGRYTLEEAALFVEANSPAEDVVRAATIVEKLINAVQNGTLTVYCQKSKERSALHKRLDWADASIYEARWNKLNDWLEKSEPDLECRFPKPDAPAAKVETKQRSITKQQVINAFDGLHFDCDQWSKALSNVPKWLEPCRVSRGRKGDKSTSATWNPVQIAGALYGDEGKGITIKKLDAVFVRLKDWADEWREVSASFRD